MTTRAATTALLTAGVLAVLTAVTAAPAAAQGDPVYGEGNVYYLSGAYNDDGMAQDVFAFGDAADEVYFGDWYGDGFDLPMVRRGNIFFVPNSDDPSVTQAVFAYGNPGDEVYVGDWNGDGVDSLMVRRGNYYFVKNDNQRTGVADRVFAYGNPDDVVLVGNWYGGLISPTTDPRGFGKGDSLTVRRGNRFFVRTDLTSGAADHTFLFGDPGDEVLVGDWITRATAGDGTETIGSGDGGDQLAVRRGNTYFQSSEVSDAVRRRTNPVTTRVFAYGDPADAVFVASLPTPVDDNGQVVPWDQATGKVTGDGLGVRRPL